MASNIWIEILIHDCHYAEIGTKPVAGQGEAMIGVKKEIQSYSHIAFIGYNVISRERKEVICLLI
jgi:hypothetical protein